MTQKHFVSLANAIKEYNKNAFDAGTNCSSPIKFGWTQLLCLADWLEKQNPRFDRERWLKYTYKEDGTL